MIKISQTETPNPVSTVNPEDKKDTKPPEEEKKEEKKDFQPLYDVFKSTPYGNFNIINDPDFDKAKSAVQSGIQKDFASASDLPGIISAFNSAVNSKNVSEIRSAFDVINQFKSSQRNVERQAIILFKNGLIKIS